jgi:hypothetical protein
MNNDIPPTDGTGNNRLTVLAGEICEAHSSCLWHATTSAQQAIEAGNRLIEAKALVKHGEWMPWLTANCRISDRTASRYMRIARSGMKSDVVADLGIRATDEALAKHMPETAADEPPPEPYDFGIPINSVKFVPEFYPRSSFDLEYVQELAEFLDELPPIEVNQHNELIDGRYRWEAHKSDLLILACQRNSRHGHRQSQANRERNALRRAKADAETQAGDA